MLTDNEREKLVERFLTGNMEADELQTFTDMLDHDAALQQLLERESGADALLHGAGSATLADDRFAHALDRAVQHASLHRSPEKKAHPLWIKLYAIAASLLLAVAGWSLFIGRGQEHASSANGNTVVQDSVQCRSGKSICHLTENALYLSEEGSRVRVIHDDDSTLNVVLSQGNVCFDIGKEESRPVTVATPHAAVVLSSAAVTRIVVTELETEVTVLDGSAEVVHRYHRESPSMLAAGGTVFADFDAVQIAQTIAPEVCESRTSMFRKYVTWVSKQAHG